MAERHFIILTALLASMSVFSTPIVLAAGGEQTLQEAIRREDSAYNDYYRELRKLGARPTEAQKATLQERTVGQARIEVARAKQEIMAEQEKDLRSFFIEQYKQIVSSKLPLWLTDPVEFWKRGGGPAVAGSKEETDAETLAEVETEPNASEDPAPVEEFIDASGVKRQLVFPGKKSGRSLPLPSPSPSASILQLDGKSGPVEMLRFPGAPVKKSEKPDSKKSK